MKTNPAQKDGVLGFSALSGPASSQSPERDHSRVSTDSIVSCGRVSRDRWPLTKKGPRSYRRWRVFHAEPPAGVAPTRAELSRRSRILRRCFIGPFQQTIASAVRQGLRATLFAPEKQLGDQTAEKFVREKIERLPAGCVNA